MELGMGGYVDATAVSGMAQRLGLVEERFAVSFATFLAGLRVHAQTVGSCLFLVFRLDYNSFYARLQIATEVAEESKAPVTVATDTNDIEAAHFGADADAGACSAAKTDQEADGVDDEEREEFVEEDDSADGRGDTKDACDAEDTVSAGLVSALREGDDSK
jgi:hypothetical protein